MNNQYISKVHFEIYSVVYDQNDTDHQPMVYVRDRQSLSGTLVNGKTIGSREHGVTPGHLLSQGDIITIQPFWEFAVSLQDRDSWRFSLNQIQYRETEVTHNVFQSPRDRLLIRQRRSMTDIASLIEYWAVDAMAGFIWPRISRAVNKSAAKSWICIRPVVLVHLKLQD